MRYRYRAPFFVELELEYPVMGGSNVILFFVQPETADRATMYVTMLFEQPGGFSEDELAARVAFEYRVVGEDLALQERFDELALPLDPTAEFIPEITHMEALERRLRVMDSTALALCMENGMPLNVFNMDDDSSLARIISGERVGTLVTTAGGEDDGR